MQRISQKTIYFKRQMLRMSQAHMCAQCETTSTSVLGEKYSFDYFKALNSPPRATAATRTSDARKNAVFRVSRYFFQTDRKITAAVRKLQCPRPALRLIDCISAERYELTDTTNRMACDGSSNPGDVVCI